MVYVNLNITVKFGLRKNDTFKSVGALKYFYDTNVVNKCVKLTYYIKVHQFKSLERKFYYSGLSYMVTTIYFVET